LNHKSLYTAGFVRKKNCIKSIYQLLLETNLDVPMEYCSIVSTTGAQCQEVESSSRRCIAIDLELNIANRCVQSDRHALAFLSLSTAAIGKMIKFNNKLLETSYNAEVHGARKRGARLKQEPKQDVHDVAPRIFPCVAQENHRGACDVFTSAENLGVWKVWECGEWCFLYVSRKSGRLVF
jgi:hypothetical protein